MHLVEKRESLQVRGEIFWSIFKEGTGKLMEKFYIGKQNVAHHVLQVTVRRLILQKRANYLVLGTVQFPCGDQYSGYNVLIEGK